MTMRDFVFWCKGLLDIHGEPTELNAQQVKMIKDNLDLVFEELEKESKKESLQPVDWTGGGTITYYPNITVTTTGTSVLGTASAKDIVNGTTTTKRILPMY